ncbi:MAG: hypothetical protein H6707_02900 [Deltaproteobacteria bacterium]|nr:hypothetical protein [Deltaproteobacteria bacterium]
MKKQLVFVVALLAIQTTLATDASRALANRAGSLNVTATPRTDEHDGEVSFVIEAHLPGLNAREFERCLARAERPVDQQSSPSEVFDVNWTPSEEAILMSCNRQSCKFNFDPSGRQQMESGGPLAARKQLYAELVANHTFGQAKSKKRFRIRPHEVKETCADHDLFHWLLNGQLKSHDRVSWSKFSSSDRMRPTLRTVQLLNWKKGNSRCLGKTLLFADHYYDDFLELAQLTDVDDGVALRYYSRSRFDFLRYSWWARRFKGQIRNGMKNDTISRLKRVAQRCMLAKRRSARQVAQSSR